MFQPRSSKHHDQLPEEAKIVLFNEHLKDFAKIPSYGEERHAEWMDTIEHFNRLNADQQWVLRGELLRLVQTSKESIQFLPENLCFVALKEYLQKCQEDPSLDRQWDCPIALFDRLSPQKQQDLGNTLASVDDGPLSIPMKLVQLRWHLLLLEEIPSQGGVMVGTWDHSITLYEKLPENAQSDPALVTELSRLAKASEVDQINILSSPLKERLLTLKSTS